MTQRLGTLLAVLFVFCSSTTAKAQSESTHTPLQTPEAAQMQSVQPQAPPSQTTAPQKLTLDDAIRNALAQHPVFRQAPPATPTVITPTKQAKSPSFLPIS